MKNREKIVKSKVYQQSLNYLASYSPSELKLKDYMQAKRDKSEEGDISDQDIDAMIEDFKNRGYIDDVYLASNIIRRLNARGQSWRQIQEKLRRRLISLDKIYQSRDCLCQELKQDWHDLECQALQKAMEKKSSKTPEKLQAYLVRAGFEAELIRQLMPIYYKDK